MPCAGKDVGDEIEVEGTSWFMTCYGFSANHRSSSDVPSTEEDLSTDVRTTEYTKSFR
jgi:hypothetical protein